MDYGILLDMIGLWVWLLVGVVLAQQPMGGKIWTYIPNADDLNALEKLCLTNLQSFATESNYQFRLLTDFNSSVYISDPIAFTNTTSRSQIESSIARKHLLQLTVLQKEGGIWITLPSMLTQNLDWLVTLKNQPHVNNRIDSPEVVLFYDNAFMQETQARKQLKIEDLVVAPYYYAWFVAAVPNSRFIKDWRTLYTNLVTQQYSQVEQQMRKEGFSVPQYLADPQQLLEWTSRAVIQLQQKTMDKQKSQSRSLAINHYAISGIQAAKSALFLTHQANNFVHLTSKYFSQVKADSFHTTLRYLLKVDPEVEQQLLSLVEEHFPIVEHLHSAVTLQCEGDVEVPYRYIVKGSAIDRYLLQGQSKLTVYEDSYVRHKCQATFLRVYYEFAVGYILPLLLLVLHIYLIRRAILVFKPQWGIRRKYVYPQSPRV